MACARDVEARGPGEAVTAIIAAVWDALRDYKGLALWKTYAYSHYNNGDWRSGKCHFEEPFHSSVASPGMDPLALEVCPQPSIMSDALQDQG